MHRIYKYDGKKNQLESNYPKNINKDWFPCA